MIPHKTVRLRIVTRDDLPLLSAWENDLQVISEFGNFGFHPADTFEYRFSETGLISPQYGRLMVVTSDDQIVGEVSYHLEAYGPNDGSKAYNIGITILPEQRGKGYGTEAQQLLAAYLFSTYPIMRIEASTDKENIAEQRALEKAGFTREGILRRAQWRNGNWHDMVIYSKLRGE